MQKSNIPLGPSLKVTAKEKKKNKNLRMSQYICPPSFQNLQDTHAANTINFNSHQILPLAGITSSPQLAMTPKKLAHRSRNPPLPSRREKSWVFFFSVREHPVAETYLPIHFPIPRQKLYFLRLQMKLIRIITML